MNHPKGVSQVALIAETDQATPTADQKERPGMTQTVLRRKLSTFGSSGLFFLALTKF